MSTIESVKGTAVPLRGNDIDTDRIIPARYLRCVTFDGLGEHAFEDDKAQDPNHPFNQDKYSGASVLLAGKNFGCGSSREHAPQSLSKWGIKGIIGESFAEIFFGNCIAIGIPCFVVSAQDIEKLWAAVEANPATEVSMDVKTGAIIADDVQIDGQIASGAQKAFLEGSWNATMVLQQAEAEVEIVAKRLPYISQF